MSGPSVVGGRQREFRDALGQFATGVTVITTRRGDGAPVGMTASSFNSVSLDPPMVLWSVAKASSKCAAFEAADAFAVNVLADDQVALSRRFARGGEAQFEGAEWREGLDGLPLLEGCAANFQCRKVYQYEGGDHLIIVGEVRDFLAVDRRALVFHRGQYARVEPGPGAPTAPDGGYEQDFLMALLMRAAFEFTGPLKERFAALPLSEAEIRVLSFLSDAPAGRRLSTLAHGTMLPPDAVHPATAAMRASGLVEATPDADPLLAVTPAGREHVIAVLAMAKAHEADILEGYADDEVQALKRALRRLISHSRRQRRQGGSATSATR